MAKCHRHQERSGEAPKENCEMEFGQADQLREQYEATEHFTVASLCAGEQPSVCFVINQKEARRTFCTYTQKRLLEHIDP